MRTKVVYCAPIFGYPPIGGPELKALNILIALSNIYEVRLILWKKIDAPEFKRFLQDRDIQIRYVERHSFANLSRDSRILSGKALTAYRLFCHKIALEQRRDRKKIAKSIVYLAEEFGTKTVWFSYSNYHTLTFFSLRKYGGHLSLIADTDSVSSRYTLRGIPFVSVRKKLKLISDGYKEIRNEIKLIKQADALTAVSEVDAKYYSSLVARNNVTLAYNVINAAEYNPTKVIEPKKYLIITGSFGHYDSPMDHGTRWFIQKVWPIIKPKVPDLSLRIVGKNSDVVWSDMHAVDIDVYGWVSDTKPHIAGAVACVVPLWFESGTRYKILEAGILKTPVVSTSLGAEGLIVTEEIELLIADHPEDFARQILRIVCTDIGKDLSTNMYNKIVAKYSIKSLEQQVAKAIDLVSTKN